MKDRVRFRVWCVNKKQWETGKVYFDNEGRIYDDFHRVKEETHIINFCTGLKDKNGKLIYEGDILKVVGKQTEEITGCVQWLDDFCKFSLNIANSKEGKYQSCEIFCDFDYLPETEREIIGNIYENKELLGVE